MIQIDWDDRLTTGVSAIDAQHSEIFARFNVLLRACESGRSRDEVAGVLGFMNTYIDEHFTEEERFLESIDYPEVVSHRQEHRRFARRFMAVAEQFTEQGNSVQLVIKLSRVLGELIFDHIQEKDMAYARFCKVG